MSNYRVEVYADNKSVYSRVLDITEVNPADLAYYIRTAIQDVEKVFPKIPLTGLAHKE